MARRPPPAFAYRSPPAPDAAQAMQRALAAYQRGDWREAERVCASVLDAHPRHFDALYLGGLIAGQTGRAHQAVERLTQATALRPDVADAHFNRAVALGELGRTAEALESYDRALALRPGHADAHYNRAVALAALGRPDDALASYDRAIALAPASAEAHNNRGVVLNGLARPAEALASFDRALALAPGYAEAHTNRGVALGELGRAGEALASHERALALRPDSARAHNNRAVALYALGRFDESLASCERALALDPRYPEAHYNRGNALRDLGRHAEALASYERAVALRPDYAAARWNLADCRLLTGDFERGWRDYEWRFRGERASGGAREFAEPLWLGGESLAGRTILLHAELGLGDTLLFCRYATRVAALGARVLLEVQLPLVRLLSRLPGVAQTLARGTPLPPFDVHCPLMSLPLAFRTDAATIPAEVPYLAGEPAAVEAWRSRLGPPRKPRVGIVWGGSGKLANDRRSMALAELLPLLRDWAEWVSLQKEVGDADARLLAARPDVRHFGERLTDFAETAALAELMDVVVTVDTSVAHLAGAIGKPVWILLPFAAHDWRWMLDRDDSPWYPNARLFRQRAAGDWADVVRRVDEALARRFNTTG